MKTLFHPKKAPEAAPSGTSPPAEPALDEATQQSVRRMRATALRRGMLRLLTRSHAVNLALVVLLSVVAVIFLLSLVQQGVGNFTISLSRTDVYRYGIELSDEAGFISGSSRLEANAIQGATNISVNDLPDGLHNKDGSNNGLNYISYTFYVRNNGTADFDYHYQIDVKDVSRRLDEAVRIAVYYNGGNRTIFAKRGGNGAPEADTTPFATDRVVDAGSISNMKVGTVDKYTVVIWIEGDDPDCTDDLLGGMIKMAMTIQVEEGNS